MTAIVHAFALELTLLIGLPKDQFSPIQFVLNAAARLPKFSHISSFMFNQLCWLPLSAHIEFKILVLVLKSKLGVAPKYLWDHLCTRLSATSHRPLCSLDWQVLFVPHVRTTMAQTRSFATIGTSLWNAFHSSLR